MTDPSRPYRRLPLAAVATGVGGTLALTLSLGASLSGFTASINNPTNTAASGALAIEETSAGQTCRSYDATATCSGINKYGGTATPLDPGESQTQTVTFANTGSTDVGTSTLTPGACVAESTGATGSTSPPTDNTDEGNLCSVLRVAIYRGTTTSTAPLYDGTVTAFDSAVSLGALARSASQAYTFVISLPDAATTAIQGQSVSQPLTWTFNQ